ncbi:MAG TPA: TylF/MycF/NovP-related O-methyltransferase [Patescibacteria group bacterium]|nr:TylF/MycF/NovP-related O-methyltransferase [Patescibacteria group bacterium]
MANKSEFLAKRKELSENLGEQEIYSIVDHWPLYVGTKTLARTVEILDIFRSTLDVPGDIAEFGSHRGANIMYLAKLAQIYGVLDQKRLHCFESFEGLTNFKAEDGVQEGNQGRYRGNLAVLKEFISLFGFDQRILIHQGFIENTLPAFLESAPDQRFSFLYYDADLYEPCKVVLECLKDKLSVGGVFVFDEYGLEEWPGETQAVDEFLKTTDAFKVEKPGITKRPGLVLRRLK